MYVYIQCIIHISTSTQFVKWSRSVVSDSVTSRTVACTRLLHPWDFLCKSTGVGCHFFLQGIFPTQGLNPGLPHCRQMLYCLSHQGINIDIYINFTLYILYIHMVPLLQNGIWHSSMYKPSSQLRLQNHNGIVVRNILYRFRFPRSWYQFFHILAVWLFTSWSSLYIFKVMYVIIIDQGFKPRAFTNHIKHQLIFWQFIY